MTRPSNFKVDVTGVDKPSLGGALAAIFGDGREATHYAVTCSDKQKKTLVLMSIPGGDQHGTARDESGKEFSFFELPFPLTKDTVFDFVRSWLDSIPRGYYGPDPFISADGSSAWKAWRVWTPTSYDSFGGHRLIGLVSPEWAFYAK